MSTAQSTTQAVAPGTGLAAGIDPRGPQFTAAITAAVLVAVLLLPTGAATVLIAVQAGLFAIGALGGVHKTPTAWVFKHLVRPRLSAPDHLEDPAPPRFAQAVGLVFAVVALTGFLVGASAVALGATGAALVAATLNAVFRFCLGCEMYLFVRRIAR